MKQLFVFALYFDNYDAFRNNDSGFMVPLAALKGFMAGVYHILYRVGIWVSICCLIAAAILIGVYGGGNIQEYMKAKNKILGIILSVGILCAVPWMIRVIQKAFGGMRM